MFTFYSLSLFPFRYVSCRSWSWEFSRHLNVNDYLVCCQSQSKLSFSNNWVVSNGTKKVLMWCACAAQFLYLNHSYSMFSSLLSACNVSSFCAQRILEIDNNEPMQSNKPNYEIFFSSKSIFLFHPFLTIKNPHLFTICEQQAYAISSMLVNGILVCVFIIAQVSRREIEKRVVRFLVSMMTWWQLYTHSEMNDFSYEKRDPILSCLTYSAAFFLLFKEKAKYILIP